MKRSTLIHSSLTLLLFLLSVSPSPADNFDDEVNRVKANEARDKAIFDKIYNAKPAHVGDIQRSGTIQKASGKLQQPGKIQIPRGEAAISVETDRKEPCNKRYTVGTDCLFAFGKFALSKDAVETLKCLVPLLKGAAAHPITIEGHTDSIGTKESNQTLSEKRAEAVKSWLVQHKCVSPDSKTVGYGKDQPVAPNEINGKDNPAGRALNRRVVVLVNWCIPPAK